MLSIIFSEIPAFVSASDEKGAFDPANVCSRYDGATNARRNLR